MATPNEKITAGLSAGSYTIGVGVEVSPFAGTVNTAARGSPTTAEQLASIRQTVQAAHDRHQQVVEAAEQRFERAKADIEREVASITEMNAHQRQHALSRRLNESRAAIVEETAARRAELVAEVEAAATRVGETAQLFESATGFVMTSTIDDESRQRYDSLLTHSGPLELHNMAAKARAEGNRALAASVLARHAALPKSDRNASGIDRSALAESVLGPSFRAAREAIRVVDDMRHAITTRDAEFRHGRPDPIARVERGLRAHRAAGSPTNEFGAVLEVEP